ncbi:NupC/NupG family nucleoside CNT transporter [Thermoactinomyces mirandus]|uniref:NupC/NupG family nucleoside CNT transporter n=1 Tax=Thermoactinomyces mirandus TaxID=2756294 RepID=A0A7W1XSQ8_9BACL|nr:nucleoside transporter C-terminal domain-containing protein [Thermoactinomyces mirandus]MBA4602579.1 NupC/NupG family nucleoside CNT transporter [Thermoactinomyces mirandus]
MSDYIGVLGIFAVMGLAWLFSSDKKGINFKAIGIMLLLQLLVTWGMLSTRVGEVIINGVSAVILKLVDFARVGIDFVIGGLKPEGASVFVIDVLLPIIFFAAFIAILNWIGLLPWVIRIVGTAVSKITGIPKLESFNAVNAIFLGQSEVLLAIKSQLNDLGRERLYMICASAMGSVSSTIIAAYMTMLPPKYVLVAMPLNMFSALIIASILMPFRVEKEKDVVVIEKEERRRGLFEVIGEGATDGVKLVAIITGMLISFIALMEGINFITSNLTGITLQTILGYILMPFAVASGVPVSEAVTAGGIMGTKIILNEFVAILQFQDLIQHLSARTVAIVSTYLVSFANFGSIGIIAGTFKAISEKQMPVVAGFGLKLLFGASLASFLTGAMTGLFI